MDKGGGGSKKAENGWTPFVQAPFFKQSQKCSENISFFGIFPLISVSKDMLKPQVSSLLSLNFSDVEKSQFYNLN